MKSRELEDNVVMLVLEKKRQKVLKGDLKNFGILDNTFRKVQICN
jgi:hypothetical protein